MSQQVRAFQLEHSNHLGKPLKVDGDLGPQTQWAIDLNSLHPKRKAIVLKALSFIGIVEEGVNRHPLIDRWLKDCGVGVGQPWCAAMASACLGSVAIASAQILGKRFPPTVDPFPGDLMWYPTGAWQGHCGIVIGVSASEVMTVEGNLRNACRVARRARNQVNISRTCQDNSGTCPGIPPKPEIQFEETRASTEGTR
jgi:hypothetical protein